MKVSRGFVLFATIFLSLVVMNCQWIKACAAPFREFFNETMWCWTVLVAIIYYLPYVFIRKIWPTMLAIAVSYVIFWANLAYLRTFGSWIPIGSYFYISNLTDFYSSVSDSFETIDVIVPIIVMSGVILVFKTCITPINKIRLGIFSGLSLFLTGIMFVYPESISSQINLLKNSHNEHALAVSRFSFPLVYLSSIGDVPSLNNRNINEINLALGRRLCNSKITSVPKNLVIVFMESLESWPIGMTIAGKEITPVINRLATNPNTMFVRKVRNQTGAGRSIDAQLLVLCGLIPPSGTIFAFQYPGNNYPTIYKAMKEKNFSKVYSFTTDRRDIYNIGKISKQFGIDSLFVLRDKNNRQRFADADFFRNAIAQIDNNQLWDASRSKCLQFVTYSCHLPYMFPKNEITKLPRTNTMSKNLTAYIDAVHYSDYSLGILIDYLRKKTDYEQTMIVIIGDHPVFGKEMRKKLSTEISDVSEAYVPMLILNAPNSTINDNILAEQVDAYSTILRFMGLEHYAWHGLGQVIGEKYERLSFDRNKVSELILAHNLYKKTINKTNEKSSNIIVSH